MRKLIIFLTFLILACNSEPKIVTFEDVYQIELPGDMSSSTELNEDASLEYSNIFKEKYLIIIHESKEDWKKIVGETDYLKKYLNYISENFETSFNSLAQIKNINLNESTKGALVEIKGETKINLKCNPEWAEELRGEYDSINAGWHMSKKHWNTVTLNKDVSDSLAFELIDHSYDLVVSGLTKKLREQLAHL